MTKKKRLRSLREEIKKDKVPDALHSSPEDFVPGLVEEIVRSMTLPKLDLSTQESAQAAAVQLSQKLEILGQQRHRVESLRNLLEQKRLRIKS